MLKTNWRSLLPISARALMLVIVLAQAPGAMAARDGNGTSGGGGGMNLGGRHMTFYSAGLYTEFTPSQDVTEIPGLKSLVSYVRQFPYVGESRRIELMDILVPSSEHEYYKVKEDHFDAETKARLVAEFSRVTGRPVDQIDLFAVTDTQAKRTYLLPEFYLLSERDQMAILFHEAYWLLHPRSSYQTIVSAEMSFQAVMEQPENMSRVYQLMQYWGSEDEIRQARVAVDRANGALNGLLTENGIALSSLLGSEYIECWKSQQDKVCNKLLKIHLFSLTQQYPKSLLLKTLHTKVSNLVRANETFWYNVNLVQEASEDDYDQTDLLKTNGNRDRREGFPLVEWLYKRRFLRTIDQVVPIDFNQAFVVLTQKADAFSGDYQIPVRYESKSGAIYEIHFAWLE